MLQYRWRPVVQQSQANYLSKSYSAMQYYMQIFENKLSSLCRKYFLSHMDWGGVACLFPLAGNRGQTAQLYGINNEETSLPVLQLWGGTGPSSETTGEFFFFFSRCESCCLWRILPGNSWAETSTTWPPCLVAMCLLLLLPGEFLAASEKMALSFWQQIWLKEEASSPLVDCCLGLFEHCIFINLRTRMAVMKSEIGHVVSVFPSICTVMTHSLSWALLFLQYHSLENWPTTSFFVLRGQRLELAYILYTLLQWS